MWLTITMPFISKDTGLFFSNPKILKTMQPASSLTKYNVHSVVVIWSPYAPIVSQGAIMTSESLPARLSDPGRSTVRRGKKDGTDWPCMLEALSYGHRGVFLLPGKNIHPCPAGGRVVVVLCQT